MAVDRVTDDEASVVPQGVDGDDTPCEEMVVCDDDPSNPDA